LRCMHNYVRGFCGPSSISLLHALSSNGHVNDSPTHHRRRIPLPTCEPTSAMELSAPLQALLQALDAIQSASPWKEKRNRKKYLTKRVF
jgi:hypothetical protein